MIMKRLKFTLLFLSCSFILNYVAARDVINCSRTYASFGLNVSNVPNVRVNSISSATGSRIKIENQTSRDELTPVFKTAAALLAEAISDDFPLTIQIKFGEPSEFNSYIGTADLLAITTTNFVWNNFENRNPDTTSPDRNRNGMSMLIPQSIANREYLSDTDPTTPDMIIKLNPSSDIDFYYGNEPDGISDTQYDLVTVILREMVTGCGFTSSLKISRDPITQVTTLSIKDRASNNIEYPYLFDNYVYNNMGVCLSDIENSTNSIFSFLNGNNITFANNTLFNELLFATISDMSLSTLNRTFPQDGTVDLMTPILDCGTVIRKVTPITKSILENLGWKIDLNLSGYRYNIVNSDDSELNNLYPNTNYTIKTNIPSYIDWGNINYFGLYLVKSDGDFYTLNSDNAKIGKLFINYSTLPNNEWQRDPETGSVIGYIRFSAYNDAQQTYYHAFKRVLLAYAPSSAQINVLKINATSSSMDAKIDYLSQGATNYRINYTISGDPTQYYIDKPNKEDVSCVLRSLNPNRKHSIYLTASNVNGSINSQTVTIGEDPASAMALIVTKVGTTLKYQFKLGSEYVTNLVINSVGIYDTNGNLRMTVNAGINQTFSIANLTTGYYVLKVDVANSAVFSKMFMK